MDFFPYMLLAGVIGTAVVLGADLRRRRLALTRSAGWHVLNALDVVGPAVTMAIACGLVVTLAPAVTSQGVLPLRFPATWAIPAGILIFVFLWTEGRRQVQFQRPRGIVFGEWLILAGVSQLLGSYVFGASPGVPHGLVVDALCGLAILVGVLLIARVVPPFLKKGEERHIFERLMEQGESVQRKTKIRMPAGIAQVAGKRSGKTP